MSIISIIGGSLCQWDIGRKVQLRIDCNEVHIACVKDAEALVVVPYEDNGQMVADIPNILLQSGRNIVVYCVKDNITVCSKVFGVKDRERPSDYLYVETEVLSWTEITDRLHALETTGLDVVLPETHLIVEDKKANGGLIYLFEHMDLTIGKTYTVFWNGESYERVATRATTEHGGEYITLVGLGNYEDPFLIFEWPKGVNVSDKEGATAFIRVDAGIDEVDICITAKGIATVDCIYICSSESNKKFKLTVDDSGNISTTEV